MRFAADLGVRHRFVFLEDYDIAVARALYQGADVWLNNPRRPQEACGTIGHEGGPQRRPQLLDPRRLVGRVLRRRERLGHHLGRDRSRTTSAATRPRPTASSSCSSTRSSRCSTSARGPAPRGWLATMKHAFATLGPYVTASRQVRDYVTDLYEPAAAHDARLTADGVRAGQRAGGVEGPGAGGVARRARRRRESSTEPADVGELAHGRRPSSPSATSASTTSRCSCCGAGWWATTSSPTRSSSP